MRREPLALEIDFGILEGHYADEAIRLYPEHFTAPGHEQGDYRIFGGENLVDVASRAAKMIAKLPARGEVVVVGHAIFMTVMQRLLQPSHLPAHPLGLCSWTALTEGPDGRWSGMQH